MTGAERMSGGHLAAARVEQVGLVRGHDELYPVPAPGLARSRATCFLVVPMVMYGAAVISALEVPKPTGLSTSRSWWVIPVISRGLWPDTAG